jgi:hypothetical protein
MKKLFILAFLTVAFVGYSQNAKDRATNLLADKIGSFSASGETESKVIDDGATRVERAYAAADQTLEIEINIPKGKEAVEKVKGELAEILQMFDEMGNAGRMEVFKIEEQKTKGSLTYREGRGSGILFSHGRFVIELKLKGATSMDDIKSVYESLNFDALVKAKG